MMRKQQRPGRRPHRVRLRRRLRDRPRGGAAAGRARLPGRDRRPGRGRAGARPRELIGGPVLTRTLDVRDRQAQLAFAAEVAEWAPTPLGMVFNNAGVATSQSVAEGRVEDDEWVLEINCGGVVNGTRAFLPILLRQDSGVIVNTSSVFGLRRDPVSERVLRLEVRGPRLHRLAAPGAARAPACGPSPSTPAGSRPTSRATPAITRIRRGRICPTRRRRRQFDAIALTTPERAAKIIHDGRQGRPQPDPGRARRLRVRRAGPPDADALLRRARGAGSTGWRRAAPDTRRARRSDVRRR